MNIPEAKTAEDGKPYIPVLDHGYVKLLDHMGSDEDIVYAARISTRGKRKKRSDEQLLDYLIRHGHHSPLEMAELKFEVKAPIFVARQWFRHRTGNYNEISGRYTSLPDDIHIPEEFRFQDQKNRQGSWGSLKDEHLLMEYREHARNAYLLYHKMLSQGIAREQARMVLPLAQYTVFIYKSDLRNLLHFLKLRLDPHAQAEIRAYAHAIESFVIELFPKTWEAWRRNVKNAKTLSMLELAALKRLFANHPALVGEFVGILFDLVNKAGLSRSIVDEALDKLDLRGYVEDDGR